jgi:hypothetical protein
MAKSGSARKTPESVRDLGYVWNVFYNPEYYSGNLVADFLR